LVLLVKASHNRRISFKELHHPSVLLASETSTTPRDLPLYQDHSYNHLRSKLLV
jgi:hypothetical protein